MINKKREITWLVGGSLVGTALLAGAAGAAAAEEHASGDVEVNVEIEEVAVPGVLALTVDAGATHLVEEGSTELVRQFTGALPTVTVTDTRTPDEIPEGAYWYVVGSASAFSGAEGQEPIGAENLGWSPRLVDGGESGLVAEGDEVDPAIDGGAGLVDQELLAMAFESAEVSGEQSWTATADLAMRVGADVEPGTYVSNLTLSLFE